MKRTLTDAFGSLSGRRRVRCDKKIAGIPIRMPSALAVVAAPLLHPTASTKTGPTIMILSQRSWNIAMATARIAKKVVI